MPKLLFGIAVLLAGCATMAPPGAPVTGGVCRQGTTDQFVGQQVSADLGARMLAASGARVIRWVVPGQAVTMEFSEDRLTVRLDAANRVESANCG